MVLKRILQLSAVLILLAALVAACLPVGDTNATPPIRAAFVYNWFPGAWNQQGLNPFSHYTPSTPPGGFYSSTGPVIKQQIAAMQYGNLNAGIASWWGPGTTTDATMQTALDAANGTGFKWSAYYEPSSSSESAIANNLTYLGKYANQKNWLYVNNRPVLFAYTDGSCSDVANWVNANATQSQPYYLVMRVFAGYRSCATQPDLWHQYGPAVATDSQPGFSYTISPGYWKANEATPRLSRDLTRWTQNVKSLVASNAPLELITTMNEHGEGTGVESTTSWPSPSGFGQYLDVMHNNIPPVTTTTTTTTTTGSSTTTTTSSTTTTSTSTTTSTTMPSTGGHKVMVIMEENHSQSQSYSSMPYLASLATTYGKATNYFAIGHPSLPNYLEVYGGTAYSTSSDCGVGCGPTGANDRSVWDQTIAAGKSAKAYQESMPSNCATGGSGGYAPRHGPWPYWTNATSRTNCNANDVPLTALQGDITAGHLPVTGEITPNLTDDWHDGTAAQANTFLQTWVPKLQAGSDYTSGNLTIIVVTDEDDGSAGNNVAFTVINKTLSGKVVTGTFNHYSLTKWLEDNAGVPNQNNAVGAANLKSAFGL